MVMPTEILVLLIVLIVIALAIYLWYYTNKSAMTKIFVIISFSILYVIGLLCIIFEFSNLFYNAYQFTIHGLTFNDCVTAVAAIISIVGAILGAIIGVTWNKKESATVNTTKA